jgi:hypothetical protein
VHWSPRLRLRARRNRLEALIMNSANATRAAAPIDKLHQAGDAASDTEGTQPAALSLATVNASLAQPEELAAFLVYLRSELVRSLCRLLHRALGGPHG